MPKGLQNILAFDQEAHPEQGRLHFGARDRDGRSILIVKDDHVLATTIAILLDNAGYHIAAMVRSVAEIIDHLGRQHTDLAIVDRGGVEATALHAATLLRNRGIPVVLIGGDGADRPLPPAMADMPRLGAFPWAGDVLRTVSAILAAKTGGAVRAVRNH